MIAPFLSSNSSFHVGRLVARSLFLRGCHAKDSQTLERLRNRSQSAIRPGYSSVRIAFQSCESIRFLDRVVQVIAGDRSKIVEGADIIESGMAPKITRSTER